ncbi:MAG: YraN family protein [Clostridia bacterium]|nr:YraN family protein [Clostridia bacterium]
MQSNRTGRIGEELAKAYLLNKGYKFVCANYRVSGGEIDLIMMDGQTYVFVEVKTRKHSSDESAYEAVDKRKQRFLSSAAMQYIGKNNLYDMPCRFDCVFITGADEKAKIDHFINAFELVRGRYFI